MKRFQALAFRKAIWNIIYAAKRETFTFLNCLSLLSDMDADVGGISGALRDESPVVSRKNKYNTQIKIIVPLLEKITVMWQQKLTCESIYLLVV